ncbi:MAG: hypothetical protein K6E79_06255 [Pseudobutyrivibrio sp.]|nr:hypothetical protein [Pseudobutyrivibrio sp.]
MGIFTRRKTKKELRAAKIDDAFNRVYSQIDNIESWEDPKKLEHYILDSCEQIIASTKEMERQKTEYRIVTTYLNDIKKIENLPRDEAKELRNTASRILELEHSILTTKNVQRNISEEQFEVISADEATMAEIINRFASDEIYQAKLKKNLAYMEGEKSRWEIERELLSTQNKALKRSALILTTSFMAFILFLAIIIISTKADLSGLLFALFFLCALGGFLIFLRQNGIRKENHEAIVRLNQSISMLNVERMKFVNVTNGIEYQKDKYHVHNSAELQYVWEQYIDKIKDQQRYIKNNEDLEFYSSKLERILEGIGLNDDKIWMNQINALINKEDMSECRHRLVLRRQKIRDRMDDNRRIIQGERDEIERMMTAHDHYLPEIKEIIKSVDKLCGTHASSNVVLMNNHKNIGF